MGETGPPACHEVARKNQPESSFVGCQLVKTSSFSSQIPGRPCWGECSRGGHQWGFRPRGEKGWGVCPLPHLPGTCLSSHLPEPTRIASGGPLIAGKGPLRAL